MEIMGARVLVTGGARGLGRRFVLDLATEDHLVPPASSVVLDRYVGSDDVTTIAFPGGHIGVYVSSRAQRDLAPALTAWVRERC